jgi:hypothetical protein
MIFAEARFDFDRQLLQRRAEGLPADVDESDVVLYETPGDCLAYVHLANCPDPLTILFDAPVRFNRRACSDALLGELAAALH